MASDAPSYKAKVSFFRQLDFLSRLADREDDSGGNDRNDETDAETAAEEAAHRARSHAFHAALERQRRQPLTPIVVEDKSQSQSQAQSHGQSHSHSQNQSPNPRFALPRRVVSAPTPGTAAGPAPQQIVERTPLGAMPGPTRQGQGRVPLAELDASLSIVEDTPVLVPDSTRQPLRPLLPVAGQEPGGRVLLLGLGTGTEKGAPLLRSLTTPLPLAAHKRPLGGLAAGATADCGTSEFDHEYSPSVGQAKKRRRDAPRRLSSSSVASGAKKQVLGRSAKASPSSATKPSSATATVATDADRIFAGLCFFYVPDNDVAPVRKLRIAKAREHGARWVRRPEEATHVVVDRGLEFKDVAALLGSVKFSDGGPGGGGVEVVTEEYPVDCVVFRRLLDPRQKTYRVNGFPEPILAPQTPGEVSREEERPSDLEQGGRDYDGTHEGNQDGEAVNVAPLSHPSVHLRLLKEPQRNPRRWDFIPPFQGTPVQSQEESEDRQEQDSSDQALPASQQVLLELPSSMGGEVEDSPSSPVATTDIAHKGPGADERTIDATSAAEGDGDSGATTGNDAALEIVEACDTVIPTSAPNSAEMSAAGVAQKDALSEYIAMMLEFKDLPIDDEDDTMSLVEPEDDSSDPDGRISEGEKSHRRPQATTRPSTKAMAWEDRFACNSAGVKDTKNDNPNARTIEVLQSMCEYYERVDDHWRTTAYRKVIATLRRQTVRITTAEEAVRLPNVGVRLAQKIEEIATTDRLQRLKYAQMEPLDEVLQMFLKIYGVGKSQANRWVAQGFRTLEDLTQKAKLSANQRIGIDHYDDLNARILRREIRALGEVVKMAAAQLDPEVELIIGGSYRRGAESSSDIDFIVTKKGTTASGELLPFQASLIQKLEAEGFIVARLASSRGGDDGSKWHGCCILPGAPVDGGEPNEENKEVGEGKGSSKPIWRRIDFLLVPETEMGAALIYFTGDDIFNRSIRLLASKKGMRLNQRGLYRDVTRGPVRSRATDGELVEGRDERRIFEILGVKWREPHQRWC